MRRGRHRAPGSVRIEASAPCRALRRAALLAALLPAGLPPAALGPVALSLGVAGMGMGMAAAPAQAQDFGRVVSPILTLDRDRLYAGTLYGQRVRRELEAASTAMAAETRAIEAALEAEEKDLTAKRATMAPEAFRELASAFDDKVQSLRAERDAAEEDLRAQIEAAQVAFFNRIGPVLGQLVRDRGAVLIVDRRAVLLAATNVDVTTDAIERIDAVLGDGGDLGTDTDGTGTGTGEAGAVPAPQDDLGDPLAPDTPDPAGETPATDAGGATDAAPQVDTIPAPPAPGAAADPGTDN
ncbi:MAG: OmpH family outer membrane protein [Maritimibacter sp.]|nr:OmpH family outer membrane protein [Maritimibacter sp.]